MASTELPWIVLGRRVRPFAFASSLAIGFLALTLLVNRQDAGDLLDNWRTPGLFVGLASTVAFVLLVGGWWGKYDSWMRLGLLLTAGAFGARAAFIWVDTGNVLSPSAFLSFAWGVVGAGGAYLLETTAARER